MKKLNVVNSVVCGNEDGVFNYFAWPTVARLPGGDLAAVASGFRLKHICPFGKLVMCVSRDEGKTWGAPSVLIDTPLDDRDGGIAVSGNDVIVTSFNNTVAFQRDVLDNKYYSYSPDMQKMIEGYLGAFDAAEAEAKFLGSTYKMSKDGGDTFGEVRRVPVSAPHGPCVMEDGSFLYVGRMFENLDGGPELRCYKKTGDGDFKYLSSIEDITEDKGLLPCEPHAVALPGGRVIVHIRVQNHGETGKNYKNTFTLYQSDSYDGGKTFSKPRHIGIEHGSPGHLLRHSGGALVCVYGYRLTPYGQRAAISLDNGATWDADYILRDDGPDGDLGYPATVELNDGRLLTVYYQKERGRDNTVIMQSVWELPV